MSKNNCQLLSEIKRTILFSDLFIIYLKKSSKKSEFLVSLYCEKFYFINNNLYNEFKVIFMKKMIILVSLILAICSLNIYSQNLQNTSWTVFISPGHLIAYFHFSKDTLSTSFDNITYKNTSTFQEIDNNFFIVDLTDEDCPNSDTGKYTYVIQNDTLKFTLVNDLCISRSESMPIIYCVRVQTGIQNDNSTKDVKLYPNPASDEVIIQSNNEFIGTTYNICDQMGRQVLTGKLNGESSKVDIRQLSLGMYFLQIGDEDKQIFKLIKK